MTVAAFERHDVHGQADLLQLVADDRRRPLEVRPALLRQQREARRLVVPVLERAVAVAVAQPDRREHPRGARGIVGSLGDPGPIPFLVRRRLRAEHRHARAEKHRVGEHLPVDGHRNRAAQLVALQPAGARVARERSRLQVEPQAVGIVRHAEIEQLHPALVGGTLQRRVRIR